MHVGGLADGCRADRLGLPRVRADLEEAVARAPPEAGRVVEHPAAVAVEMRVGGGELTGRREGEHAGGVQRVRVELHRHRRLGHRDEALAQAGDVDVGVVGQRGAGVEEALHALEDRAARIGCELPVGDLATLLRGPVGAALQVAPAVGHASAFDREAVEHRQAVEPVAHLVRSHLEAGRPGPQQRTHQPRRQLAADGELIDHALLLERGEPERGRAAGRGARRPRGLEVALGDGGRRSGGGHGASWRARSGQ